MDHPADERIRRLLRWSTTIFTALAVIGLAIVCGALGSLVGVLIDCIDGCSSWHCATVTGLYFAALSVIVAAFIWYRHKLPLLISLLFIMNAQVDK